MDIGVFIPINNNGWITSVTSPQYMPSFDPNTAVVRKAEGSGFALSMIKLHGFGGKTEYWDHGLESFTLMAGLAAEDTTAADTSMAAAVLRSPTPVNRNMGALVGSCADVATMMDEVATMPGAKGIMLAFDDFLEGLDRFGTRIQPLMECRNGQAEAGCGMKPG